MFVTFSSIRYGMGNFVSVGQTFLDAPETNILTSPDGIQWIARRGSSLGLNGVAYGQDTNGFGRFVAVGTSSFVGVQSPVVISAGSGVSTWLPVASGLTNAPIYDVAYGNGRFAAVAKESMAVDARSVFLTSANGQSWLRQTLGITNRLTKIMFGNGVFVAVGDNGALQISSDGLTWEPRQSGVTNHFTAAVFGPDSLFLFTSDGVVLRSDPLAGVQMFTYPKLIVRGLRGRSYKVEARASFGKNDTWQTVTNLTLTADSAVWQDPQAGNFPARYYRVVLSP